MAAKKQTTKKKATKKKATKKKAAKKAATEGPGAPPEPEHLIEEVEHGGEVIVKQVGRQLDSVRARVADVASTVVGTTTAVGERVTSQETRDLIFELVDDVEKIGKYALDQVSGTVGALQRRIADLIDEYYVTEPENAGSGKKAKKKKVTRKKAAKKKAARKKAGAKKTTRKKATTGKAGTRKKTGTKKTGKKSAGTSRTATSSAKKKSAKKRATRKKR